MSQTIARSTLRPVPTPTQTKEPLHKPHGLKRQQIGGSDSAAKRAKARAPTRLGSEQGAIAQENIDQEYTYTAFQVEELFSFLLTTNGIGRSENSQLCKTFSIFFQPGGSSHSTQGSSRRPAGVSRNSHFRYQLALKIGQVPFSKIKLLTTLALLVKEIIAPPTKHWNPCRDDGEAAVLLENLGCRGIKLDNYLTFLKGTPTYNLAKPPEGYETVLDYLHYYHLLLEDTEITDKVADKGSWALLHSLYLQLPLSPCKSRETDAATAQSVQHATQNSKEPNHTVRHHQDNETSISTSKLILNAEPYFEKVLAFYVPEEETRTKMLHCLGEMCMHLSLAPGDEGREQPEPLFSMSQVPGTEEEPDADEEPDAEGEPDDPIPMSPGQVSIDSDDFRTLQE